MGPRCQFPRCCYDKGCWGWHPALMNTLHRHGCRFQPLFLWCVPFLGGDLSENDCSFAGTAYSHTQSWGAFRCFASSQSDHVACLYERFPWGLRLLGGLSGALGSRRRKKLRGWTETSGSGRLPQQPRGKQGFLLHGASVGSLQEEAQRLGGCGAEQGRGWQGGTQHCAVQDLSVQLLWQVSGVVVWGTWSQEAPQDWQQRPVETKCVLVTKDTRTVPHTCPKQPAVLVAPGVAVLPLACWGALALGGKKGTGLGLCLPVGEWGAVAGAGLLAATDCGVEWVNGFGYYFLCYCPGKNVQPLNI